METLKQQIRVIFTIITKKGAKENSTAILGNIDENEILIKTTKPMRFDKRDFITASIKTTYGNHSNIVFFLTEIVDSGFEKNFAGTVYTYKFKAPKKKRCNLEKYGLENMEVDCSGYEKLCSMLRPKRLKKRGY